MKFELYKPVAFARDVPEQGIKKGDIGTTVEYYEEPEPGYALEIFNALGESIDVVAVPESYLETVHEDERVQVRHVYTSAV